MNSIGFLAGTIVIGKIFFFIISRLIRNHKFDMISSVSAVLDTSPYENERTLAT